MITGVLKDQPANSTLRFEWLASYDIVTQAHPSAAVNWGVFGPFTLVELAPGASLRNGSLNLLTFATRSRLRYLKFFGAVLAGRQTFSREIELVEASSVECRACDGSTRPIFVEADGEVLGSLPVRLEVAPHPLMLLVPDGVQP